MGEKVCGVLGMCSVRRQQESFVVVRAFRAAKLARTPRRKSGSHYSHSLHLSGKHSGHMFMLTGIITVIAEPKSSLTSTLSRYGCHAERP